MALLENLVRALAEKERRLLRSVLTRRRRRLAGLRRRTFATGLSLFVALAAFAMLATILDKKPPPWYLSFLVGFGVALPISFWSYLSLRPKLLAQVRQIESALRRNEACVTHIQSEVMAEFEEEEDEGACYAFQLNDRQIVFVSGQGFYPSARFPNSDFSLVSICDGEILVESLIEKHGAKLKPIRSISSEQKSRMRIPSHLGTMQGDLNHIEQLLA